ncbi:MAG: transposase [Armatimonadetes bacterium]|nr:transposase [Armatimonadota bacterium]
MDQIRSPFAETVSARLAIYIRYYNEDRPHSSLGYRVPASALSQSKEVYLYKTFFKNGGRPHPARSNEIRQVNENPNISRHCGRKAHFALAIVYLSFLSQDPTCAKS